MLVLALVGVLSLGRRSLGLTLVAHHLDGRTHLPIVELKRTA